MYCAKLTGECFILDIYTSTLSLFICKQLNECVDANVSLLFLFAYRPLLQSKFDVLNQTGLSMEDFSKVGNLLMEVHGLVGR